MADLKQLLNLTNELHDPFSCPICLSKYERSGKIFQCSNGHDICESCKIKVDICPHCRAEFSGARNFGLEKVIDLMGNLTTKTTKVDEVKADDTVIEYGPKNYKHNLFSGPKQGKGLFRCRFDNCGISEPICRLLNHVRTFHKRHLIEVGKEEYEENYSHKFDIRMKSLSRVYQIPKYGLFFLVIQIHYDNTEEVTKLYAWLQIAAPDSYAKKIRYSLDMVVDDKDERVRIRYTDIPHTAKMNPDKIISASNCLKIVSNPDSSKQIGVTLTVQQNKWKKRHSTHQKVKKSKK